MLKSCVPERRNKVSSPDTHIPRVSIGMPVYNGEKYICQALDSLLAQTFSDFELIISDNASTDGTEKICKQYEKKDIRIRYVRHSQNRGGLWNFNFVLQKARGEYFMYAAHDDLCEPSYVTELLECFQEDESLVLCASDVVIIDSIGNPIRVEHLKSIYITENNNCLKTRRLFFRYPTSNIFFAIYGLYKREALKKCGIPSNSWKGFLTNSEVPFLARLSLSGRIAAIAKPLKAYRTHDGSCYKMEAKKISFLDLQLLQISILKQIVDILRKSKISNQEKTVLYGIVFYYGARMFLVKFIYHYPKKILKLFLKRFNNAPKHLNILK